MRGLSLPLQVEDHDILLLADLTQVLIGHTQLASSLLSRVTSSSRSLMVVCALSSAARSHWSCPYASSRAKCARSRADCAFLRADCSC
jgi:hypothetical protein